MSSNLPLRTIRIPALQRQCLFHRHRHVQSPRAFSTTVPQSFASTSPCLRGKGLGRQDKSMTKAAVKNSTGPAPGVNFEKAQRDVNSLAEDIGILQDTIIRASMRQLPAPWSPRFWGYFWKLVKSKATGMYSRSAYKRCIYKSGVKSYLPIDAFNGSQLKDRAKTMYKQIYENFARGDMKSASSLLLPPLARNFKNRIDARGTLKMDWKLQKCSARIVSHRASLLGETNPDSGYRQLVVRLDSTQVLKISNAGLEKGWTPHASKSSLPKGLTWKPEGTVNKTKSVAKSDKPSMDFADNGVPKRVVEYMVLQKRVVGGSEEAWKVWGFVQESTPEVIEEDEDYWRKLTEAQAGQV
ncbi:hypothetical protein FB567DRAFT_138554 [Paraphoma chrysanthemicola]|uniref:Tim44-like domain-containing protein n=1 Tax=Paraphoma chrysanthemicola TaxID=798071 RepID=A0A8K0VVR3_9PLEO|nr:hypothetical protein FB567DRAFT_138554 [Paraphoma chrysanthemicola]